MKGQGKVKGILVEGNDGHEYLLGFGPLNTPVFSRRAAEFLRGPRGVSSWTAKPERHCRRNRRRSMSGATIPRRSPRPPWRRARLPSVSPEAGG